MFTGNDLSGNDFDLCISAKDWMTAKKRAFSWKTKNIKRFLLKSPPSAFYKDRLLFINGLCLEISTVTSDGLEYFNKIQIPDSCAKSLRFPVSVEMNSTIIVINTTDMSIIQGYLNSAFQMFLGIRDGKLIDVSDDISGYLRFRKESDTIFCFEPTCFCGHTLLVLLQNIYLHVGPVYVVNLVKKEIIPIQVPFVYSCAVPSKNHIYFGAEKQVMIFDTRGKIVCESENFNLIVNNDKLVTELCKDELNIY